MKNTSLLRNKRSFFKLSRFSKSAGVLVCICILLVFSGVALARHNTAPRKQVLILHDSSGPFGYLGKEYAIMLRNLVGHFDADITTLPVSSYSAGLANSKDATFYIGSTFDEESYLTPGSTAHLNYRAFLADAATTSSTIAWINYNLWKLAFEWDPSWGAEGFTSKFGYSYIGAQNLSFNRVEYKGVELFKGVVPWVNPGANLIGCFHEGGPAYGCAPELNMISITNAAVAQVKATAYSTLDITEGGPQKAPYATRSENFWFIGDLPFSYTSEEDRYLAFADLLHDILDSGIQQQPLRAMVRFEDVSAGVDPASLEAVMGYLANQNIPFAVATVPIFKDPQGVTSDGIPVTKRLAGSTVGRKVKKYFDAGYASIVAHGYSHQAGRLNNPYNSLTGDDFEFYRVTLNPDFSLNFLGGVPGDSYYWAYYRMLYSKWELSRAGLRAFTWEAPHYFATAIDYKAIRRVYPVHYGRMIYHPKTGPAGRFVGQFFPYVIKRDSYGYRQIPENMGSIEPEPFLGYRALLPEDLIRHAEKLKVVRDSVASFYYHPFLGTEYLDQVVQGLKANGYEFIAPCSLGFRCY